MAESRSIAAEAASARGGSGPVIAPGAEEAVRALGERMGGILMGPMYGERGTRLCAELRRGLPNGCVAEPILNEGQDSLLVYQVVKERLVAGYALTIEQCEAIAAALD